MNNVYRNKVELLLRILPFVMDERVFAVHGGSAINLFFKDMPRYSVDIDLTYIPLAGREESLNDINSHLSSIAEKAKNSIHGLHIVPKYATCKLLCEYHGYQIKIESVLNKAILFGKITSLRISKTIRLSNGSWSTLPNSKSKTPPNLNPKSKNSRIVSTNNIPL